MCHLEPAPWLTPADSSAGKLMKRRTSAPAPLCGLEERMPLNPQLRMWHINIISVAIIIIIITCAYDNVAATRPVVCMFQAWDSPGGQEQDAFISSADWEECSSLGSLLLSSI